MIGKATWLAASIRQPAIGTPGFPLGADLPGGARDPAVALRPRFARRSGGPGAGQYPPAFARARARISVSGDVAGAVERDDVQAIVILIRPVRAAQTKASRFRLDACEPPRELCLNSRKLGA